MSIPMFQYFTRWFNRDEMLYRIFSDYDLNAFVSWLIYTIRKDFDQDEIDNILHSIQYNSTLEYLIQIRDYNISDKILCRLFPRCLNLEDRHKAEQEIKRLLRRSDDTLFLTFVLYIIYINWYQNDAFMIQQLIKAIRITPINQIQDILLHAEQITMNWPTRRNFAVLTYSLETFCNHRRLTQGVVVPNMATCVFYPTRFRRQFAGFL